MKLMLDPADLKPEFRDEEGKTARPKISTWQVTFDKLSEEAQAAVRAVGRATYCSWDGLTYNSVRPPSLEGDRSGENIHSYLQGEGVTI